MYQDISKNGYAFGGGMRAVASWGCCRFYTSVVPFEFHQPVTEEDDSIFFSFIGAPDMVN